MGANKSAEQAARFSLADQLAHLSLIPALLPSCRSDSWLASAQSWA